MHSHAEQAANAPMAARMRAANASQCPPGVHSMFDPCPGNCTDPLPDEAFAPELPPAPAEQGPGAARRRTGPRRRWGALPPRRVRRDRVPQPPVRARPGRAAGAAVTDTYRVLVTGSRDWTHTATVRAALNSVLAEIPAPRPIIVVHGDCPTGADIMAKVWATTWCQDERVTEESHPAAWHLGPAAGPLRNAAMVSAGADLCLAFIGPCAKRDCRRPQPHGSHGATECADLAEQAGIPVRRWTA